MVAPQLNAAQRLQAYTQQRNEIQRYLEEDAEVEFENVHQAIDMLRDLARRAFALDRPDVDLTEVNAAHLRVDLANVDLPAGLLNVRNDRMKLYVISEELHEQNQAYLNYHKYDGHHQLTERSIVSIAAAECKYERDGITFDPHDREGITIDPIGVNRILVRPELLDTFLTAVHEQFAFQDGYDGPPLKVIVDWCLDAIHTGMGPDVKRPRLMADVNLHQVYLAQRAGLPRQLHALRQIPGPDEENLYVDPFPVLAPNEIVHWRSFLRGMGQRRWIPEENICAQVARARFSAIAITTTDRGSLLWEGGPDRLGINTGPPIW